MATLKKEEENISMNTKMQVAKKVEVEVGGNMKSKKKKKRKRRRTRKKF